MSDLFISGTNGPILFYGNVKLDPSLQFNITEITDLLSTEGTLAELVENGQAANAIALIKALPHEAQATIFAASGSERALRDGGQEEEVKKIKAELEKFPARPGGAPVYLGKEKLAPVIK